MELDKVFNANSTVFKIKLPPLAIEQIIPIVEPVHIFTLSIILIGLIIRPVIILLSILIIIGILLLNNLIILG